MPATFAHPALVLPLLRTPLVPAALVAGSVAPDVPYFVRVPRSAQAWYEPLVNATTTHAWPGMLVVAVPTAAVLMLLLRLVTVPVADLVGLRDQDATGSASTPLPVRAAWVAASLGLGVLTHVGWDSFTHADGLVVQRVDLLQAHAVAGLSVARVLQHVSTAVGVLALAWWVGARLLRRRAEGRPLTVTSGSRVVLAAIGLVAAVAAALSARPGLTAGVPVENLLSDVVTGVGAATVLAVLAYAVVWHMIAWRALSTGVTRAPLPGGPGTTAVTRG